MLRVYYEPNCVLFLHKDARRHEHKMANASKTGPQLAKIFFEWTGNKSRQDLTLFLDDPILAFKRFSLQFIHMEAAGGLVNNPGGQVMMIYRLGKWDLPKGKLDKTELSEAAAIREVEEECGISGLTVIDELPATFHVYPHKDGNWVMKKTRWYLMHAESWENPVPQKEEQIMKAVWCDKSALTSIKNEAYRSIADLLEYYLETYQS